MRTLKAANTSEQSTLDGSLTEKVDYEWVGSFVEADRESVGSPRDPIYWAMEVARNLRDWPASTPEDVYDRVIAKAKETGLSKDQEKMIKWLLKEWMVPVPLTGVSEEKPEVESNSTINFQQKQVAASIGFPAKSVGDNLSAQNQRVAAVSKFLHAADFYRSNRQAARHAIHEGRARKRVSQLIADGFSKPEIRDELVKWDLPKPVQAILLKALADPPRMALSTGPLKLSNGKRVARQNKRAAALGAIAANAQIPPKATPQQLLRIAGLKDKFSFQIPFWITASKSGIVSARGLCEDGRVITAQIAPTGKDVTKFHPSESLKRLAKKMGSMEEAWVELNSKA
jgi:hypothetical protein